MAEPAPTPGQLQREAAEVLRHVVDDLRSEPVSSLHRYLPHKVVREHVSPSGVKYAVEMWANPDEGESVTFVLEAYALVDLSWTPRLGGWVLDLLPDGSWEETPLYLGPEE